MRSKRKSVDQKRKEQKLRYRKVHFTDSCSIDVNAGEDLDGEKSHLEHNCVASNESEHGMLQTAVIQEHNALMNSECMKERQLAETQQKKQLRLEAAKQSMKKLREMETKNVREVRLSKDRENKRVQRSGETEEKRLKRLRKDCENTRVKRAEEPEMKRMSRLRKDSQNTKMKRADESYEKKLSRLRKDCVNTSVKRAEETEEKRLSRLRKNCVNTKMKRVKETKEAKITRLKKVCEKNRQKRKDESKEGRFVRLMNVRDNNKQKRKVETPYMRLGRLSAVRETMRRLRLDEGRDKDARLQREKVQKRALRQRGKLYIPTVQELVTNYKRNLKEACDYVCVSCHRLMYRLTVVNYNPESYPERSLTIIKQISKYRMQSAHQKEWICRTCHLSVKRGKMPIQCKANNLELMTLPEDLKDLNSLEVRLISKRIPFMKIVGLPRGKQQAIHGPAVNVPSNVDDVCTLFPRLPSELQIVPSVQSML